MSSTTATPIQVFPDFAEFKRLSAKQKRLPIVAQRQVEKLCPFSLYSALFGEQAGSFLLESSKGFGTIARYSFFGASKSNALRLESDSDQSLTDILDRVEFDPHSQQLDYLPHFWGGWIALFSYETARWLEPVNLTHSDDVGFPDVYLIETGPLLVYDHEEALLKCIITVPLSGELETAYQSTLDSLFTLWNQIDLFLETAPSPFSSANKGNDANRSNIRANFSRKEYCEIVDKAKQYIEEGDIYQANLSQRFELPYSKSAQELYQILREVNPSPFGGLLQLGDSTVVSSSPERLVKVEEGWIETRPIAGTRPRGGSSDEDHRLQGDLLLNEKERAEHLMLVDLERNDLGRICEYDSVAVSDLMFLETYSHVHHIVSNIRGRLRKEIGLEDILSAVFPGGTITGCPKIRCMQIIEELETVRRGPYCGSLGYIGYGPHLDFNILIRTILLKNETAYFHAGAGIVADSNPEKEYEETLSKAAALIEATQES